MTQRVAWCATLLVAGACAVAGAADPRWILDFKAPDAARRWQAVNDGVMGGVSEGRFRLAPEGAMEFSGRLSLENNGGFASVRSRGTDLGLVAGDSLVVRARGDGREYLVNLTVRSGRMAFAYRAPLPTIDGEVTETTLPLADFVPTSFGRPVRGMGPVNPREVTSVGFMLSDGRPGEFRLTIEAIGVLPAGDGAGR